VSAASLPARSSWLVTAPASRTPPSPTRPSWEAPAAMWASSATGHAPLVHLASSTSTLLTGRVLGCEDAAVVWGRSARTDWRSELLVFMHCWLGRCG
jgi:hypothetical protein